MSVKLPFAKRLLAAIASTLSLKRGGLLPKSKDDDTPDTWTESRTKMTKYRRRRAVRRAMAREARRCNRKFQKSGCEK